MSIQIGDVEVAKEIIELRHQLIRTQLILEALINKNSEKLKLPTKEDMKAIDEKAYNKLKDLYPTMVKRQK